MEFVTRSTLTISWYDGRATALDAMTGQVCEVSRDTLLILDRCAGGATVQQVTEDLRADGYDVDPAEVHSTLTELQAAGLVRRAAAGGGNPDANAAWRRWGPEAMLFHFGTKDVPFAASAEEAERLYADVSAHAQPPLFKRYPRAPTVVLPRPRPVESRRFVDVLLNRRTVREFDERAVEVEQLSAVLFYSFAPQSFVDIDGLGALPLRPYANGGARSELEIYLNVRGVAGLDDGLYHYEPVAHCLEFLRERLDQAQLTHLSHQQVMCARAPVTLFVTGVVERLAHKYHNARALRVMYLDAGHLGQTFALVATAHGLGPYQTAAFRDSDVERALGIDGTDETVLYLLGFGVPAAVVENRLRPAGLGAAALTRLYDDQP
ncbi:SagB/ThcOx family dehydrogenase [Plantactinospora sp. KLBMP9567]|uniref:SagB/ThcOx family dehydrogenase n=1 Tax=Plantactinospora sp. KLBMP9567 TaxID=3085900 RepID=UPI0029824824|nr:SagB/ThcOx family dehydrogenase [Plantactinospora sp. KLBMP9567]MDW5328872.1 SagB/ThcOx family dehydrogenase [Plantactinospora sp. KLBMP9567]